MVNQKEKEQKFFFRNGEKYIGMLINGKFYTSAYKRSRLQLLVDAALDIDISGIKRKRI